MFLEKGSLVKIAQGAVLSEYSKKEKTLYYGKTISEPIVAIYLRDFIEYNDYLSEVIVGDKILYTERKSLREISYDKNNKTSVYYGTNSNI